MTERFKSSFVQLVTTPSESSHEGAVARLVAHELSQMGFETYFDDTTAQTGSDSGNLIAFKPGKRDRQPIIFSCHLDTVTPGIGIVPQIRDDCFYSSGTTILGSDDKAGIASLLEATRQIMEENQEHGDLTYLFTVSEEIGLLGAKSVRLPESAGKLMFVLDCSGPPGQAIFQAPTATSLSIQIQGRRSHAGVAPEAGISAIQVMARAINNMRLLRIDEETTANIGTITGGIADNIVPDECQVTMEIRSLKPEKMIREIELIKESVANAAEAAGAKYIIHEELDYPPFQTTIDNPAVKLFTQACSELGLPLNLVKYGGGSDANIHRSNGYDVLNLSIGNKKPHSVNESICFSDMLSVVELIRRLIALA